MRLDGSSALVWFALAPTDVRGSEQVAAAVAMAAETAPLRVLVNCAGTGPPGRVSRKGQPMELQQFAGVIEVNLTWPASGLAWSRSPRGSLTRR